MMSKAEREHIVKLKTWSAEARAGFQALKNSSMGKLLELLTKDRVTAPEVIFDNFDWLIALIDREYHREGVRALRGAVERHKQENQQ